MKMWKRSGFVADGIYIKDRFKSFPILLILFIKVHKRRNIFVNFDRIVRSTITYDYNINYISTYKVKFKTILGNNSNLKDIMIVIGML